MFYLPEVKHMEEHRDLHQVDPAADVVVPQHDEVTTQLQAGLLYQVGLPVALQDLQQVRRVDVGRVLGDQLGEDDTAVRLVQESVQPLTVGQHSESQAKQI